MNEVGYKYKMVLDEHARYVDGVASLLGTDRLGEKYEWFLTASDEEIEYASSYEDWRQVGAGIINAMKDYERTARLSKGLRATT